MGVRYDIEIAGGPLETLKNCGGYYECPRDASGRRVGPLVGYAGTYSVENGARQNYVGDVYYNFSRAERYHHVLDYFAALLFYILKRINVIERVDAVLGAPMGGICIAGALGKVFDIAAIFAEKKIIKAEKDGKRGESALVLGRHEVCAGERVLLAEDVCNNFSTADELASLVENAGAHVVGIACVINRSYRGIYFHNGRNIPVASVLHKPTEQFRQDDIRVSEDICRGNVVWKPKHSWEVLQTAMEK